MSKPSFDALKGVRLGVWETGVFGMQWVTDLENKQKCFHLGGYGYPAQYTALAANIIPLIRKDPPGAMKTWAISPTDIILPGWLGKLH